MQDNEGVALGCYIPRFQRYGQTRGLTLTRMREGGRLMSLFSDVLRRYAFFEPEDGLMSGLGCAL